MSDPTVSLLVPIYNVERYLKECLDSARAQTLDDIEVICINDGSTDSSRAIIQEYLDADSRFRVVDKSNSGYGASMNMGLEAARGEYIAILESDDFFEPDALEKLVSAARKFDVPVAKANFWFYWSTPEEKNELFELVSSEMADRVVDLEQERDIFYLKPSIWSAVYRRDFLNGNSIRFLETPGASYQDAAFNFKVWACAKRATFLHEAVIHYRQDNEASSVNSPSKVYCVCDEYREMFSFVDASPERADLVPVLEKMKYDSYMWNYNRLSETLRREFLDRFSQEFRQDTANGKVDLSYFEWWKKRDLQTIMDNPALFHAQREASKHPSQLKKLQIYFRHGGFPMVLKAFGQKMSR